MLLTLLFFVVAMGFSIYCWLKREGVLGLLSFLLWFLFVVHSFGLSIARWDLFFDFGLFGCLMALIMVFTSIFMIIQKQTIPGEEEKPRYESYEDIFADIEKENKPKPKKGEVSEEI